MVTLGLRFPRMRVRRATVILLYVLIIAGSLMRVVEGFRHNPLDELFSDPFRHWEHARVTLAAGVWAIIDPPVFQMWVSLVQKWSLAIPVLVGGYAALLSAITPWLWYRFLREALNERMLALAGWAAFAWLPSWIAIFSYFMTETLFLPLLGASLWQTMRADRKGSVSSICAMTSLWLLTAMTRGVAAPLGAVACLWVWLRQPDKVPKALASSLIIFLLAFPIALRNHEYFGLWSPLGTGWPNQIYAASGKKEIHLNFTRGSTASAYNFGSPSLYRKQLDPLSDWEPKRVGVVNVFVDLTKGAEDWRSSYERNAVHGWESLRLRWENLVLVMLGISWPDDDFNWLEVRCSNGMRWAWPPLLLLVVGVAAAQYRNTLTRPLLPMLISAWFLVQAVSLLVVNEGRYRKPLEGLLIAETLVLLDSGRAKTPRRGRIEPAANALRGEGANESG
jgi:hypothetical protein